MFTSFFLRIYNKFFVKINFFSFLLQNFRDQQIDGSGLPLLTEEHLTNSLGLKLGPALKLKSILAKKFGGPCPCVSCSLISPLGTNSNIPRPLSADSGS